MTGGEVLLLPSRLLTAVVARATGQGQGYLLVGTVDRVTLQTAAAELFASPPPFR